MEIQRPKGAYAPRAFPVGSVFIAVVSTDPATLLGYGTWSAFGAGKVLIGLDSGDTDFDTVEETGGAKTKSISAHADTAVADHAAHTHTGPSHQHNLSGGAATAHSHTYTQTVDHVHVQTLPSTQAGNFASGTRDTSTGGTGGTPGTVADALSTANPTGSAGATGTTANNTGGVTDNAGTGNTGNPSATLTHSVTQPSAHTDLNVVQPYIVCYFWKRTA